MNTKATYVLHATFNRQLTSFTVQNLTDVFMNYMDGVIYINVTSLGQTSSGFSRLKFSLRQISYYI